MFSTSTRDLVINPLHCRIPLLNVPIGVWVNLSIDVISFVSECFKSQTFRSIDFISITANCKIKRIFSMRNSLLEFEKNLNEDFQIELADVLPRNIALPSNVPQENINLNIERLKMILQMEGEMKNSKENINYNNNIAGNVIIHNNNSNNSHLYSNDLSGGNLVTTINTNTNIGKQNYTGSNINMISPNSKKNENFKNSNSNYNNLNTVLVTQNNYILKNFI